MGASLPEGGDEVVHGHHPHNGRREDDRNQGRPGEQRSIGGAHVIDRDGLETQDYSNEDEPQWVPPHTLTVSDRPGHPSNFKLRHYQRSGLDRAPLAHPAGGDGGAVKGRRGRGERV